MLTYRTQIETHRHVGLPVVYRACPLLRVVMMREECSFRVERPTGKTQRRRWKRRTKVSETGKIMDWYYDERQRRSRKEGKKKKEEIENRRTAARGEIVRYQQKSGAKHGKKEKKKTRKPFHHHLDEVQE